MIEALLKWLSPQSCSSSWNGQTRAAPHIRQHPFGNTQKLKMYTYTQATGYWVCILVKRPRYRRDIAQLLVAIRGGGVILRTPRGPSELLHRSGFGRPGTPCSRGAAAASCSFSSRRVGEWTPYRSARPTAPGPAHPPIPQRLSSTGSVLSPSFPAAAAS